MTVARIHPPPTWLPLVPFIRSTRVCTWGLALLVLTFPGCGGETEPSMAPAPSASFSLSPTTPLVGQTVQFSDLSTGNPTSWSWDFGDGSTSASRDPSHSYAAPGSFTVTLTVANASGSNRTTQTLTCRTTAMTAEVRLSGGQYDMGDHFGFVDLNHPSDELPIHKVRIDPFFVAINDTTNAQFLAYLNDAISKRLIEVRSGVVYGAGTNVVYYYTHDYASSYSINLTGTAFSIVDFRANHPVVGVVWSGAAAYCNWLSAQNGLQPCYNTNTWTCDFSKSGYRLPTEAEWEYAARGGQYNPYYNYPWGNTPDITKANWPDSHDPYEGIDASTHPWTTPVGFYNGQIRLKSDFNWPGAATSYQTSNGANAFGLYDMGGNVWQFLNDWYDQNYYGISPYDNPKGPDAGSPMPDGLPYRNMRGGNWYNGDMVSGVNDGHSRVSNRDPSYYRGPLEQKQSWNGVGFRVARNDGPVLNTAGAAGDVEGNR
jgi:formylglycine-generating enzyme required for sulfatase activity